MNETKNILHVQYYCILCRTSQIEKKTLWHPQLMFEIQTFH